MVHKELIALKAFHTAYNTSTAQKTINNSKKPAEIHLPVYQYGTKMHDFFIVQFTQVTDFIF